jgi:hypothetical protein
MLDVGLRAVRATDDALLAAMPQLLRTSLLEALALLAADAGCGNGT